MALQNTQTNEYLKVVGIQLDFQQSNYNVVYLIFADLEQRQRYESGLNQYEQYQSGQFNSYGHIETALLSEPNESETTKAAIYKAAYNALKADMFNEWIDC